MSDRAFLALPLRTASTSAAQPASTTPLTYHPVAPGRARAAAGTVTGVQGSMQSLFEIISFVAGSILSAPPEFHWLMLGSLCAISGAGLLYLAYALRGARRGWRPYRQLVDGGG